jgi:hypothetical protein
MKRDALRRFFNSPLFEKADMIPEKKQEKKRNEVSMRKEF